MSKKKAQQQKPSEAISDIIAQLDTLKDGIKEGQSRREIYNYIELIKICVERLSI